MKRSADEFNNPISESESYPEGHAYQENHFEKETGDPVPENASYSEMGRTVEDYSLPSSNRSRSIVEDRPADSAYPSETGRNGNTESQNSSNSGNGGSKQTGDMGSSAASSGSSSISSSAVSSSAASTAAASISSVATVAVSAAAVVVIAAAVVLPMITGMPSGVIFEEILSTDSSIFYQIYFEDYEEGMELTVDLHNNFTSRTYAVDSERIMVTEYNLKPGMEYTLTVLGPMSVPIKETTVKTTGTPSVSTLTMNYIEFVPDDGKIRYSMTVSDVEEKWSGFTATLSYMNEYNREIEVASQPVADLFGENSLAFRFEDSLEHSGIFRIHCLEGGSTDVVLYESNLTVYDVPYMRVNDVVMDSGTGDLKFNVKYYDPHSVYYSYQAKAMVVNASDENQTFSVTREITSPGTVTIADVANAYTFYRLNLMVSAWNGIEDVVLFDEEYQNYDVPAFGNVSAVYDPESGVCKVTFDLVDPYNQYTSLMASLTSGDLNSIESFTNADRSVTIPVDNGGLRGHTATLEILNEKILIKKIENISLFADNSELSVLSSHIYPSGEAQNGMISVEFRFVDGDRIWSDYYAKIVQQSAGKDIQLYSNKLDLTGGAEIMVQEFYLEAEMADGPIMLTITANERQHDGTIEEGKTICLAEITESGVNSSTGGTGGQ